MKMNDYFESIESIVDNFSEGKMKSLAETSKLDDYFEALNEAEKNIGIFKKFYREPERCDKLRSKIEEQQNRIIHYCLECYSVENSFSAGASCKPDYLFVLGSLENEHLENRIAALPKLLDNLQNPKIILSGGGFDHNTTEAQKMYNRLSSDIKRNFEIILEEHSIDTIANALFSNLELRMRHLPLVKKTGLIVTSDYHMSRALNIFRKVFGKNMRFYAYPIKTQTTSNELLDSMRKELNSDARSSREIFSFQDPFTKGINDIEDGDIYSIMIKMFSFHDYYRFRYDLLRYYQGIL
jgi:uncharacterized SAM-binding protein YcdF (DUF218 family)